MQRCADFQGARIIDGAGLRRLSSVLRDWKTFSRAYQVEMSKMTREQRVNTCRSADQVKTRLQKWRSQGAADSAAQVDRRHPYPSLLHLQSWAFYGPVCNSVHAKLCNLYNIFLTNETCYIGFDEHTAKILMLQNNGRVQQKK